MNELLIYHMFPPKTLLQTLSPVCRGFPWVLVSQIKRRIPCDGSLRVYDYFYRLWSAEHTNTDLQQAFCSVWTVQRSQTCLDECVDWKPGRDLSFFFFLCVFKYEPILDTKTSYCNILKSPSRSFSNRYRSEVYALCSVYGFRGALIGSPRLQVFHVILILFFFLLCWSGR